MDKRLAQEALRPLLPGYYRHMKGGAFVLYSSSVDEATGEALASYFSVLTHKRWTRLQAVFLELVPPEGEDASTGRHVPRFSWWRPATRIELAAAAFGGPDELLQVFGRIPSPPP